MKVILLQDIKNVGRKFEVKEVASGYAANALFPKGLAIQATAKKIKELESKKETHDKEVAAKEASLTDQLKALEGQTLNLEAKASEKGGLFKGLKENDVAKIILDQKKVEISTGDLEFDSPIKTTGEHKIAVSHGDVKATFMLLIKEA